MKKVMLLSVLFLFLGLVPYAFAEGFVPLAPIPGLTDIQYAPNGLAAFFNNLYKYLIGLAAALAVIQIIWGGLEIAVNKDNVSKITDSKGKIYNAIFGLVLVLSPVLVFSIINPNILNLSLNLPPLDTRSGPPTVTPGQVTTPVTTGSGNPCGSINVGGSRDGNCVTTTFTEGTYASPPVGAWCYQFQTPVDGDTVMCYRDQNGCRASCRNSSGTTARMPIAGDETTCTAGCTVRF